MGEDCAWELCCKVQCQWLTGYRKHGEARKSDPQDFWVFGGRSLDYVVHHGSTSDLRHADQNVNTGALLGEAVQAGSPPSVVGSCMLAYASSKEEIIERLKRDVLVNEKVWDWDSLSVRPFWRPSRQPL